MNAERAALLVAGGTAALLLAALHLTLSAPAITVDTVAPAPVAASASPQTGPQTGPQTDAPTSPQTRPQPAPAHPAPNHPDPLATAPPRGPIQIETLGPPGRSRPVVAGEIIFVFGPATAPATARRHLADAGFTLLHWHPALGAARAAVPPGLSVRDALAHAAATPNQPPAAPHARRTRTMTAPMTAGTAQSRAS